MWLGISKTGPHLRNIQLHLHQVGYASNLIQVSPVQCASPMDIRRWNVSAFRIDLSFDGYLPIEMLDTSHIYMSALPVQFNVE